MLVDTSVWIDHLRKADVSLVQLLRDGRVLAHPMVIGEIAMGSLSQRVSVVSELQRLPMVLEATHAEALSFLAHRQLYNLGIGYIDVHLLAAARLTPGAMLWTRDKRLRNAAGTLGLCFHP